MEVEEHMGEVNGNVKNTIQKEKKKYAYLGTFQWDGCLCPGEWIEQNKI